MSSDEERADPTDATGERTAADGDDTVPAADRHPDETASVSPDADTAARDTAPSAPAETESPAEPTPTAPETPASPAPAEPTPTAPPAPAPTQPPTQPTSRVLVAYFSCTGNTKAVARRLAALCGADIYEITAAVPYTTADLNYNQANCRANREMNDESARPAIGSGTIDLSAYDTVLIGYPIWWGTMPRIINTFLDTYDLSGKTVMPFCTSGGSDVSRSVSDIRNAEPQADVRDGLRASGSGDSLLEKWLSDNHIV